MNIIRHENPDKTKCPICYDLLNSQDIYTIPDCNHTFHTNCIVHWFRNGYSHCPLCNHSGLGTTKYTNTSITPFHNLVKHNKTKFKLINKYAEQNKGPKWLQEKITVYNNNQLKIKQIKQQIKTISNSEGVYNDIYKKIKKLEKEQNILEWDSKKREKIIMSYPIYPVIIVQHKKPKQKKNKVNNKVNKNL